MNKALIATSAICLLVALGIGNLALGNTAVKGDEPAMMVSPQTIVLDKVTTVTVHTNIPAGSVVTGSVALDAAAPISVWADDCGHLAARFAVADLDLTPGEAVLTLTGTFVGEEAKTFSAEDTVSVKADTGPR